MVCSPRLKRVLSGAFALWLLCCGAEALAPQAAFARNNNGTEAQASNLLGLVSVGLSPDGGSLVFNANRPFTGNETRNFSILRLPSPYRLLVDIPNARIATGQTLFSINRNGIDRVELLNNTSPFYSAVRAVVYVTDSRMLSNLHPIFEGSALVLAGTAPALAASPSPETPVPANRVVPLRLNRPAQPIPPLVARPAPALTTKQPPVPALDNAGSQAAPAGPSQSVLGTSIPAGTSIVEDVYFKDNRLFIKSNAGTELHVKNRFTLSAPSRLVLDIDNAVLGDRRLMNPINGNSDEVRQIRVGQFDDRTVRLVIESTLPEQFDAVYPEKDRNLLAISPYSATSISQLSANTRLGEVQSIDLKRENGGMVVRVTASAPIVHRFLKQNDKITLDLLNEAAHPTPIGFDQRQFPEVDKMRIEPLTDGQPNSKLVIKLAGASNRVIPTISEDGKILELLISGDDNASPGNALGNLIGLGAAGKAPFPARIVVDAGHGGKDMGANRSGVMEKDLNLSLALMLRDALTAKGFKVYMTRSTDVFLPLPQITAITNQIHPDLFISIHHNASVNPALAGIETYYFTPQSVPLARRVHTREINAVGVRDGGVKQARFYVIHHTDVPAILCEVGYVSNPSELSDLQSIDRKLKTARSIADGVVDYLKTRVSAKAR